MDGIMRDEILAHIASNATALNELSDKLDRVQAAASLGSFVAIYFGYIQRNEEPPSGMKEYIESQTGLTL